MSDYASSNHESTPETSIPEYIEVKQKLNRISTTVYTTPYWKCLSIEESVVINTSKYAVEGNILCDFEDSDPLVTYISHSITPTHHTDLFSDVFGVPPFCFGEADASVTTVEYYTEGALDLIPQLTHTH